MNEFRSNKKKREAIGRIQLGGKILMRKKKLKYKWKCFHLLVKYQSIQNQFIHQMAKLIYLKYSIMIKDQAEEVLHKEKKQYQIYLIWHRKANMKKDNIDSKRVMSSLEMRMCNLRGLEMKSYNKYMWMKFYKLWIIALK